MKLTVSVQNVKYRIYANLQKNIIYHSPKKQNCIFILKDKFQNLNQTTSVAAHKLDLIYYDD